MLRLLFALLLCVGCQKAELPMKKESVFRLNFPFDPGTLDPRKNSDYVSSTAHFMLYEGLTRMTPASTHELGLADFIDISADKKTYTFHLKETFWSDGAPVVAEDFAYAWRTLLAPDFPSPNAHLFYPILNAEQVKKGLISPEELGLKVIDPLTLEVTLEAPTPYFLDLTSFCTFSPVPSHIVKTNPRWADTLTPAFVTNGPFSLERLELARDYIFRKNPRYWDAEHVSLDRIDVMILSHEQTALRLFEQGKLDFYGAFNPIPADWVGKLQASNKLLKRPIGATTFVTLNLSHPALKNYHIRKALSLATERQTLVDNITQCHEEVALRIVPSLLSGTKEPLCPDGDASLARAHLNAGLKEIGLTKKDLDALVFCYSSGSNNKLIAQTLQQQWKECLGLSIRIEELDFKILMDKFNRRDYHLGLSLWIVQYNDSMNILDRFRLKSNIKNYPGWENSKFADLLDRSALVETPGERSALLREAETLLMSELPFIPLYHWNCLYLQQDHVHGLYISPVGSVHLNGVLL